jgi:hypothetical protein
MNCGDCGRIPVNDMVVKAIREDGKCPDFVEGT